MNICTCIIFIIKSVEKRNLKTRSNVFLFLGSEAIFPTARLCLPNNDGRGSESHQSVSASVTELAIQPRSRPIPSALAGGRNATWPWVSSSRVQPERLQCSTGPRDGFAGDRRFRPGPPLPPPPPPLTSISSVAHGSHDPSPVSLMPLRSISIHELLFHSLCSVG